MLIQSSFFHHVARCIVLNVKPVTYARFCAIANQLGA